jgi:hypothetical protein
MENDYRELRLVEESTGVQIFSSEREERSQIESLPPSGVSHLEIIGDLSSLLQ